MTYKQLRKRLEKIADEVDEYLGTLERDGKDKGKNYDTLLDMNCALREIVDNIAQDD